MQDKDEIEKDKTQNVQIHVKIRKQSTGKRHDVRIRR